MVIDVIGGQKWTVILGMPWLAHYNSEIDWRTGEVKITRCLEECGNSGDQCKRNQDGENHKEEARKKERRKG